MRSSISLLLMAASLALACGDVIVATPLSRAPSAANPTTVDDVTMPSSAVRSEDCPQIEWPSSDAHDQLLHAGDFEALDARLYAYLDAYKANPLCEAMLRDAWNQMGWRHEGNPEALDEWVAGSARPAAALTARGRAYTDKGYDARGRKFARDTPAENFRRMRELHAKARADLMHAMKLQPDSPIALASWANLVRASGDPETLLPMLEQYLERDPLSARARLDVINAFEPKWGGDIAVMHRIAAEAQAHADRNRRLVPLQGFAHAYLAAEAWRQKDYAKAEAAYTKALASGDWNSEWSVYRSKMRRYLEDYPGALIDAERAVEQTPYSDEAWDALGHALKGLKRYDEAAEAWTKAIEYDADYLWYYERRGLAYDASNRFEEAAADFRKSTELDPERHYGWSTLGYFLAVDLDRHAEAIPVLERATRLKPGYPRNWYLLGLSHERLGEYDAARSHYARYLEAEAKSDRPSEMWIARARGFEKRREQAAMAGTDAGAPRMPGLSGLSSSAQ